MQLRYQVELQQPLPGWAWRAVCARRFRTLESARRQAVRWLARHPEVTTRFGRRRNEWACRIADLGKDRSGAILACPYVDPPIVLVPSVGELGWAP